MVKTETVSVAVYKPFSDSGEKSSPGDITAFFYELGERKCYYSRYTYLDFFGFCVCLSNDILH